MIPLSTISAANSGGVCSKTDFAVCTIIFALSLIFAFVVMYDAAGVRRAAGKQAKLLNKIVETRLRDEIRRGVQTIQYQVVTLQTTNGQAPFITVYMDINEAPEGQEREET